MLSNSASEIPPLLLEVLLRLFLRVFLGVFLGMLVVVAAEIRACMLGMVEACDETVCCEDCDMTAALVLESEENLRS